MDTDRVPLSQREYVALQTVFGAYSTLEAYYKDLEKRAKLRKNLWRDLCMVRSALSRVMEGILLTVPGKKLISIQKELHSTRLYIKVNGIPADTGDDTMCLVPAKALDGIIAYVADVECAFCQKCGGDVKKCKIHKIIDDIMPWDLELVNNVCPLAMYNERAMEEKK